MRRFFLFTIVLLLIGSVSILSANDASKLTSQIDIVKGKEIVMKDQVLIPAHTIRDPGDVLNSWVATGIMAWGLGYDQSSGHIWIADPATKTAYEYTAEGEQLGSIDIGSLWIDATPFDMAFDNNGYMLIAQSGDDNAIYQVDTETGTTVSFLTGPWVTYPRGLAYDPISGDIFVGDWSSSTVYRVKGFDSDNPGESVDEMNTGMGISGLAYNFVGSTGNGTLWIAENASPEFIYEVDPDNSYEVLNTYPAPGDGAGYGGAGAAIDELGNLWLVCQGNNTVYQMEGYPTYLGGISGNVTLENADDYSGVRVSVGNRAGVTDEFGEYSILGVAPGTYDVQAFALGYGYDTVTDVVVDEIMVDDVDFSLVLIGGPPENLSASDDQETTVTITWDTPAGESPIGYNLYRSSVSGASYSMLANTTELSYVDENVGETMWYYVVTALYNDGESFYSNEDEGSIDIPPMSPSNLIGELNGEAVTLQWDDNSEDDVVSYNIYYRLGTGGDFNAIANVSESEALVENVPDGVNYYYVTAVDGGDPALESPPSDMVQILKGSIPPTTLNATSGLDGHVELAWVPPGVFYYEEDFESNDGGYTATNSDPEGWAYGAPTSGPMSGHDGSENLWATNLAAEYAEANGNYTLDSPTITVVGGTPYLTYWAWYDIENSWDGFNIKLSLDGGQTWQIIEPEGGYPDDSITGLGEPGFTGTNDFWVQHAFDMSEFSGQEAIIRWHFGGDGSVNRMGLYLDDVFVGDIMAQRDTRDLTEYRLYRGVELDTYELISTFDPDVVEYDDWNDNNEGLINGTTYYYCVRADYDDEDESGCATATAVPENWAPPTPQNLEGELDESTVSLTWDAVEVYDLAGYNVYSRLGLGGDFIQVANTENTEVDVDIPDGVNFLYVVSVDTYGMESAPSNEIQFSVGPIPPTLVSAVSGLDGYVELSWIPPGVFFYEEDFEASDGGYIATNSDAEGWAYGAPTSGPMSGHDDSENLWATNLAAEYAEANGNYTLDSPTITVVGGTPYLTYWAWYDIENSWDGFNIKLSLDGGQTWQIIEPEGGYPDDSITGLGEPGFTGTNDFWVQHAFDISEFSGQDAIIRWHFGGDGSVNRMGLYLDDIFIGDVDVTRDMVGYNIYRNEEPSDYELIASVSADVTEYSDGVPDGEPLINGTTYYYCVRAEYDDEVESGCSTTSGTPANWAPPTPENLQITYENRIVDLSWDDVDVYDFAGYNVWRSLNFGAYAIINSEMLTDVSYTDDLTSSEDGVYMYAVTTVDTYDENSDPSSPVQALIGNIPPMSPNATGGGDGYITLNWGPPGGGGGVAGLLEGFEENVMPPTDWTVIESDASEHWSMADYNPYEGLYNAHCLYDEALNPQDEWMISPQVSLAGVANPYISFWWMGSYTWFVDPNDNGEVYVKISTDQGVTWDAIWSESDAGVFTDWEWYNTVLDLSAYAGQGAMFAFNYTGTDAAEFGFDYIDVNSDAGRLLSLRNNRVSSPSILNAPPDAKSYGKAISMLEAAGVEPILNNPFRPAETLVSTARDLRDLEQFNIYRSTESGFDVNTETFVGSTEDGEILSYVDDGPDPENLPPGLDDGLANDVTYYYVITAFYGDDGESSPTSEVSAMPVNAAPPVPENLAVDSITDRIVSLSWDEVDVYDLAGYNVWRTLGFEGEFVQINSDGLVTSESYQDDLGNAEDGVYLYKVTAQDAYEEEGGLSNQVIALVGNIPPTTLSAEGGLDGHIPLNWVPPGMPPGEEGWLQWDNGENNDAIGLTSGGTFYYAVRFDVVDVDPFVNSYLSLVEFWANVPSVTLVLKVWEGGSLGNPGTEIYTQDVTDFEAEQFSQVGLDTPIQLQSDLEYWIGFEATHNAGDFPAGCDAGPQVPDKGGWISLDGAAWEQLVGYGLDFNWNIHCFISPFPTSMPDSPLAQLGDAQSTYSAGNFTVHNVQGSGLSVQFNDAVTEYMDRDFKALGMNQVLNAYRSNHVSQDAIAVRDTRDHEGYRLYRSTSPGVQPTAANLVIEISDPTVLEYDDFGPDDDNLPTGLDEGLANGTQYYYIISAIYSDGGESATTEEISAVPINAPPADPTNLGVASQGREVTLFWDDNTEYDFMEYLVFRRTAESNFSQIGTSDDALYTDSLDDEPDGLYYYRVAAMDYYNTLSDGYSNEVQTPIGLIPVSNVQATSGPTGEYIRVSWSHPLGGGGAAGFTEGFEDNVMPPPDWTVIESDASEHWSMSDYNPYEGAYNSHCLYDEALNPQDEWMISPAVALDSDSYISFWWMGSYTWFVDPNDNGEVYVKISTDQGATWESLWSESDAGVFTDWEWYETTIDLGGYSGSSAIFGFNYTGADAAEFGFDFIDVNGGARNLSLHTGSADRPSLTNAPAYAKSYAQAVSIMQDKGIEVNLPEPLDASDNYGLIRNDDNPAVRDDLIGFRIYRREGLTGSFDEMNTPTLNGDPNATFYDDFEVSSVEDIMYCYKVAVLYNVDDESDQRPEGNDGACALPEDGMAPAAPSNLGAEGLCDQEIIRLSWVNPSLNANGDQLTDLYKVTIYRNNAAIHQIVAENQESMPMFYEDESVDPETIYEYYVTAEDYEPNMSEESNHVTMSACAPTGFAIVDLVDPTAGMATGEILRDAIQGWSPDASVSIYTSIEELPPVVSGMDAIFVLLGIYGLGYHPLTEEEATPLVNYLEAGGNLYMEGSDTWAYDTETALHPYFNIVGLADGTGDLATVTGVAGFADGYEFSYIGGNSYIDHIDPMNGSYVVMENQEVGYNCMVANDAGSYKTVGSSFQLGGLADTGTSTLTDLLGDMMEVFFELPVSIELASFDYLVNEETIMLNWSVGSATDHLGFNLYRSENPEVTGELLNDALIVGGNDYSYADASVQGETTYYYRLADVDIEGKETFQSEILVVKTPRFGPSEFSLEQNFPNPFNPMTTISFAIKEPAHTTLKVYNTSGQLVKTLVDQPLERDYYNMIWDGTNSNHAKVSSGIYFYTLEAGDFHTMKKMTLLK